jgi:hypothetical protein
MPFNPDAWRKAADERESAGPPDGRYDLELADSATITSNKDGRLWLKLTWNVLGGEHRDELFTTMHSINQYDRDGNPSQALGITIGMIESMGVNARELYSERELRDAMEALRGDYFDVNVKHSGQFTNVNVNGPLRKQDVTTSTPEPAAAAAASAPAAEPARAVDPATGKAFDF